MTRSRTFARIAELVQMGDVKISDHGYEELLHDDILANEVLDGLPGGTVVEDYPDYGKGPCALILQRDGNGRPIHVVWGIPKGHDRPAVLVTAYRPDPERWTNDFRQRIE